MNLKVVRQRSTRSHSFSMKNYANRMNDGSSSYSSIDRILAIRHMVSLKIDKSGEKHVYRVTVDQLKACKVHNELNCYKISSE